MSLSNLSPESQRALEWMNLVLGTLCLAVTLFCWVTSPRSASGGTVVTFLAAAVLLAGLPFLALTSAMLLFSNQRRAMGGFVALLISLVAIAQYGIARD